MHTDHIAHMEATVSKLRAEAATHDATIAQMGTKLDARAERIEALAAGKGVAEARSSALAAAMAAVEAKVVERRPDMNHIVEDVRVCLCPEPYYLVIAGIRAPIRYGISFEEVSERGCPRLLPNFMEGVWACLD